LLLVCGELVWPFGGANAAVNSTASDQPAQTDDAVKASTAPQLIPGTNDWRIAQATAHMLEKYHYLHLKLDPALSGKFFTMYVNTLDPQHIHFLQSDLDEFEKYRTTLGDMTFKKHDASAAYVIFGRFLQRLEERTDYAKELLGAGSFSFDDEEQMSLSRKTAAFPKGMEEARQLWRQRLRFEY